MTNTTVTRGSMAALVLAHVAGMVDMVALPLWVGTLMQTYDFQAQGAGLVVTLFLLAVALTAMLLSSVFARLPRRGALSAFGFLLAAACFYWASGLQPGADRRTEMMVFHALAGVGIGMGLSMTHGAMGRTANPHRMFAIANTLLGVFTVIFWATMPKVVASVGGHAIFLLFATLMLAAALASACLYPAIEVQAPRQGVAKRPIPRAAWLAIGALVFLTVNNAMITSFIERVGAGHGFGADRIGLALLALGLFNLFPGPLAALLERRVPAVRVGVLVPLAQALIALVIFHTQDYVFYAVAVALCVAPALFGHIFLFGLIARLDPSGRAAASNPAIVMIGSSIGPFLGGTLVQHLGYGAVGAAAVVIAACTALAAWLSARGQGRTLVAEGAQA